MKNPTAFTKTCLEEEQLSHMTNTATLYIFFMAKGHYHQVILTSL